MKPGNEFKKAKRANNGFAEEDAEKLIRTMWGNDAFEREDHEADPWQEGVNNDGAKAGGFLHELKEINEGYSGEGKRILLSALLKKMEKNGGHDDLATAVLVRKELDDENFLRTRRLAVHGRSGRDRETGEVILKKSPDLDGAASLWLLRNFAGNREDVRFVHPGEHVPGRHNVDTGNKTGIVREGETSWGDHHGENAPKNISAADVHYKELLKDGKIKLKDKKYLDRLIEFVNRVDNADYEIPADYWDNFHRTILGLKGSINENNFPKLVKFFRDGKHSPSDILSDEELKEYGFAGESKNAEMDIKSAGKELERLQEAGLIVDSKYYGRIAVDIGGRLKAFDAARAFGCETYINWNEESNGFFISSRQPLKDFAGLPGKRIRENMWIKPLRDESELDLTLKELLTHKMGVGIRGINKELRTFAEQESLAKEIKDMREKGGEPDRETLDKYFGNKFSFLMSKYRNDDLDLRGQVLSLKAEMAENKFENEELTGRMDIALSKRRRLAETAINGLVEMALKRGRNRPERVKREIIKAWTYNFKDAPGAKGLVAEDIETAIAWAEGRIAKGAKKKEPQTDQNADNKIIDNKNAPGEIIGPSGAEDVSETEWQARSRRLKREASGLAGKNAALARAKDFAEEHELISKDYQGSDKKIMLRNLMKRMREEGRDEHNPELAERVSADLEAVEHELAETEKPDPLDLKELAAAEKRRREAATDHERIARIYGGREGYNGLLTDYNDLAELEMDGANEVAVFNFESREVKKLRKPKEYARWNKLRAEIAVDSFKAFNRWREKEESAGAEDVDSAAWQELMDKGLGLDLAAGNENARAANMAVAVKHRNHCRNMEKRDPKNAAAWAEKTAAWEKKIDDFYKSATADTSGGLGKEMAGRDIKELYIDDFETEREANELLAKLGLEAQVHGELKCALDAEMVKIDLEKNKSVQEILDGLKLSAEEKEAVKNNIELTLNGALDAEAEREFSRVWKYHKKVLAAGIGIGALAGVCSAGARMLPGVREVMGAGKIVGGMALGAGAGYLRGKIREWLNPAIEKIKKNNGKKLSKVREEKAKELLSQNNLKAVVVQELRRTALDRLAGEGKWHDPARYKEDAGALVETQEGLRNLGAEEKAKMVKGIAVMAEIMNENSRRLKDIIKRQGGGRRLSETQKSTLLGATIGGVTGVAQAIARSPYMPAIAVGAISGIMTGHAIDIAWAKHELDKKTAKMAGEVDRMEEELKRPKAELAPEQANKLKSFLESGLLDTHPLAREKAKKILMEEFLRSADEFSRDQVAAENRKLKKKFKRSTVKKILSYAAGIGGGALAGAAGNLIFEEVRGLVGAEAAEHPAGGRPREGWREMLTEMKAERDKYKLPATDTDLEKIAKFHVRPDKAMELLYKKSPDGLLSRMLQEADRRKTAGGGTETVRGPEGAAPPGPSEEDVMERAEKMDAMITEDMELHKDKGVAPDDLKHISDEIEADRRNDLKAISEDIEAQKVSVPEVKTAAEVRVEGKIDTFSEAIYEAAKRADAATQDNFIKKVFTLLDKEVKIDSPQTRQKLLGQAVRELSTANIETGDKLDVANLIHKGNIVRLNTDGSWEVARGDGAAEAKAVSELVLRQNAARGWARELGIDPEKVRYAGSEKNMAVRDMVTEVEGAEVTIDDRGYYKTEAEGHHIIGNIEKGAGTGAIAEHIQETRRAHVEAADKTEAEKTKAMIDQRRQYVEGLKRTYGIDEETMKKIDINPYDGLSRHEFLKIDHLAAHSGNLDQAIDSMKLADGASGISYRDAYDYYFQLKGFEGNARGMEGVLLLLRDDYKAGLEKIFGLAVTENNYEFSKDVHRIKDVAPGFDIAVKIDGGEIKFGVDGPFGKWSWGAGGRSWRCRIDADLTEANVKEAKAELRAMAKLPGENAGVGTILRALNELPDAETGTGTTEEAVLDSVNTAKEKIEEDIMPK